MATSENDKLTKAVEQWSGTIGSGGVSNDTTTTIPLSSATDLPTSTAIYLSIDRVDSNGDETPDKWEVIKGIVSGTDIVNCARGVEGTAQAHDAGAVVEYLWTASQWNDAIDGVLQDHDQSGQHKDLTDANGAEWIKQTATADAVNEVTIANAATGNAPALAASGDDTNINVEITPKGTGNVTVGGTDLINYRVRPTPASVDLDKDGTEEGFSDWDVSSIVGDKAVRIHLWTRVQDDTVGSFLAFRKNGETGGTGGMEMIYNRVAATGSNFTAELSVECDENGVIEYQTSDAGGSSIQQARAVVIGWWEKAS